MHKAFFTYQSETLQEKYKIRRRAQLTYSLEVKSNHLAASIPKDLRHVV